MGAMGGGVVQCGTHGYSGGQMGTMGIYGYNGGYRCNRGYIFAMGERYMQWGTNG